MVQHGRLPSKPKPFEPQYNPYALVELIVNGLSTQGRPFEFNAEPVNANTTLDSSGQQIYPTQCAAPCPQCGDGLIITLPGQLSGPLRLDCLDILECRLRKRAVAPALMIDPFRNPFLEGLMAVGDVDLTLVSALEIPQPPSGTVAERLSQMVLPAVEDEP